MVEHWIIPQRFRVRVLAIKQTSFHRLLLFRQELGRSHANRTSPLPHSKKSDVPGSRSNQVDGGGFSLPNQPNPTKNKPIQPNLMNIYLTITLLVLATFIFKAVWDNYSHIIIVWEHEKVLHFRYGKLIVELEPGRHRLWGAGHETKRFDTRWQEQVIQGQEFLTKDKASVKVSGLIRFRIADAKKHQAASAYAWQTLYSAAQMALRDVVGGVGIETALERNDDFGNQLKELVAPVAETLGYELDAVLIRDLMPASDLKRVLTQVMTAKQESLAGLEKARGEAAAMRVMANAARAFDKNPALLHLRFVQMLENSGGYNNQLILGSMDPLMGFLKNNET